jgi:uncharacterized protein YndB with AHSA1/START domain
MINQERGPLLRLPFLALSTASILLAQDSVTVTRRAAPDKALVFQVDVPASRAAVWEAFSTSTGLITWLAPEAFVNLRNGGEWTARFPTGSTGGGTIVRFNPGRELVLSALAPDRFPAVRAERTTAIFEFETVGDRTRVRLTQTGWKQGEEWDRAYDYLAAGNAQLLEALRQRFSSGPLHWPKILAGSKQ